MADAIPGSATQQSSTMVLGSGMKFIEDYLRKASKATDDELTYLKTILDLRVKKRQTSDAGHTTYGFPSVVIDNFLYHGDLGHASNIGLLNQLSIRHIINICDCALDQIIVDKLNVLWINLYDEMQVDIKKHFDATNQFLYDCRQKNERVLVHCQMGISRSSSVVLAYLMKYHHDSLYKAYEYLLERRRMAAPNLSFFLQLIRYESELRKSKEIDATKHQDDKQNPIKTLDSST